MSNIFDNQQQYGNRQQQQQPMQQQQLDFQTFSYSDQSAYQNPTYSAGNGQSMPLLHQIDSNSTPIDGGSFSLANLRVAFSTGDYIDEPPLLEELGINFGHIISKGWTVLNPLKKFDKHIMDDTDLAGPLVFLILFGSFLLLSGKTHFGYVYGVAVLGWISMYCILNLMTDSGVDAYKTASVLGYCLLPMVFLCSVLGLMYQSNLSQYNNIALLISGGSVLWCTYSASLMFVTVLSMADQRLLIAYPIALLYSAFAILAI